MLQNTLLRLCLACSSIGMGYFVYLFGRPGPAIYAIPNTLEQWTQFFPVLGEISGQLPAFFHTYAFILLTFIVLGKHFRHRLFVSIALWVSLESLFEIGQHPIVSNALVRVIPDWFGQSPILNITTSYFQQGTFDPLDLLAIVLASIATVLTIRATNEKGVRHA